MRGALRCGALALMAGLVWATSAAADSGNAERGRALYEGSVQLVASTTRGAPVPAILAACVQCHRPSGLGGFEGGTAIPPIAGRYLFQSLDPDTAKFFPWATRHRVRPAYDAAALAQTLRTGVAADGKALQAPMPIYRLDDADARDLTAYLRGLSLGPAPGVDETTVRIATITTPGVDAVRAEAMLRVLRTFEASRNSQTRQEVQRSAHATRTREMQKARKFRLWKIVHWELKGDPSAWLAQLDRLYAQEPVFGVLSGMGAGDWSPVEAFCEQQRLPCILPQVEQVPLLAAAQKRFYSLYFHAGLEQDLALAIGALQRAGVRDIELWSDPATSPTQQRIAQQLQAAGLNRTARATTPTQAVLSLLPPEEHAARWRARAASPAVVAWLPGARWLSAQQWSDAVAGSAGAVLVSPLRPSEEAAANMLRARGWLRANGLSALPADVASTSLYAASVFGDTLEHLDFDFTREYMLELLEHGLENMVPLSPYPRLAIGPDQRVASKGSHLGLVKDGHITWQWQAAP